jgi:hypothetical protein
MVESGGYSDEQTPSHLDFLSAVLTTTGPTRRRPYENPKFKPETLIAGCSPHPGGAFALLLDDGLVRLMGE